MKELMDSEKNPLCWDKKIKNKVLLDDTEFDVTEFDPMSTFVIEPEILQSSRILENTFRDFDSISVIQTGIMKNSVPVFKTKSMGMTKWASAYITTELELYFPETTDSERCFQDTKSKKLNNLVTKMPNTLSTVAQNKQPTVNKFDERNYQEDVDFSNDERYLLVCISLSLEI